MWKFHLMLSVSFLPQIFSGCSSTHTPDNVVSVCTKTADRDIACGSSLSHEEIQTTCEKIQTCLSNAMHTEFVRRYNDCLTSPACEVSDDTCIQSFVQERLKVSRYKSINDQCIARHATCNSFSEEICNTLLILNDSTETSLIGCLEKECDQIKPCYQEKMKSLNCE